MPVRDLSENELRELSGDGYDAAPSVRVLDAAELDILDSDQRPRSSFLRRFASNLGDLPYELYDTAKGLAQGTFHVDPAKARGLAENLGVRSAITKTVPLVDSVFDLSAGAAQKGAELVGAKETAAEIELTRMRSYEATDRLNAWNAELDKQSIVGPKWAQRLRAADQSITESIGLGVAGGPKLATNVMADYYAVKGTQDYLREHPDASPWWGGVHGLIEGATTKFFMDKFRPTDARLAGASESQVAPLYSRALAKVKEKIPFEKTVDVLAGLGAEVAEEVTIYNGHYWADVMGGLEKHDWAKYGAGMKETLIQTGLTAGAAEAGMGIANTMAKREASMEKAIETELTREEQRLDAEEQAMRPEGEQEADAKKKPAPAQKKQTPAAKPVERTIEERMADVASRKRQIKQARVQEGVDRKQNTPGGELNPTPSPEPTNTEERWQQIAEKERELARAREELTGKLTPKRRAELQNQVAEMSASLAEEVTTLIGEEGGPASFEAETPLVTTRAQRRILSLQKKLDAANARIKGIRHKQSRGEHVRRELVDEAFDLLTDTLPALERKGLEKRAANIKTPEQFNNFLDGVNDRLAQRGKKLAHRRVSAAMKRAEQTSRQSKSAKASLADVTKNVDLGSKTSRNQLAGMKAYLAQHPEKSVPSWYADAISRLDKKHKNELTTDDLNGLADAIEAVSTAANNESLARDAYRGQNAETFAQAVVDEVAVSEPLRRTLVGNVIGEAGWIAANIGVRPETIMASLSESLRQLAWENIGVKAFRDYMQKARQPVAQMAKFLDSLGLSPAGSLAMVGRGGSKLNQWRHEAKSIGGVVLTRAEALHIYGLLSDPQAAARLARSGAILGRARSIGRKSVRTHLDVSEATIREIAAFIGPQGEQIVAKAAHEINTTMRDQVNEAWVARYGHELSSRNDYFPMKVDADFVDQAALGEPFEKFQNFVLESFSVLQERDEAASVPLEVRDFFNVYGKHADTTARVAAYLNPMADFFDVAKRPEVKAAISDATSPHVYDGILEAVNQQVLPVVDKGAVSRLARRLVRGSGAAILGLRATTPYMAVTSSITASQYLPNGERLAAAALSQMANPANLNRLEAMLSQMSPYWGQRFHDIVGEATGGLGGVTGHFNPGPRLEHATMYHITAADKFSSLLKGFMVEAHVEQNRGISPSDPRFAEEVAIEWERLMYRTESTSNGLESTGGVRAGRRNGVVAAAFQFESGQSKDRSLLMKAGQDFRDGRYKAGAKAAAAWASNQMWIAMIGLLAAATRGTKDEEGLSGRAAREAVSQLPGPLGEVAAGMFRKAQGLATWEGPVTSLGEVLAETVGAGYEASGAVYSYIAGEVDDEGHPAYASQLKEAVGKMVPLVSAALKLPIETAIDSGGLALNLVGVEGDMADEIKDALRELADEESIKGPRAKIWRAINEGDDELFLSGMAEIAAKSAEKLSDRTLVSVINTRFSTLSQIERRLATDETLRLTPQAEARIEEMRAERERLYTAMAEMVERNYGQVTELLPDSL